MTDKNISMWKVEEFLIDNLLTNGDFGNGTEDEKCENVFNWWISGKSYEEWYADTFRQLRFNFEDYE